LPLVIRTAVWQVAILTKHIVEWKAVVQIFVDIRLNFLFTGVPILKQHSTTHTFLTVRKIHYCHDIMTIVTMATMTAIVHTVCRFSARVPLSLLSHKSTPPPRYYSLLSEVQRPLAGQYYAQYYCLKWILCNVFFFLSLDDSMLLLGISVCSCVTMSKSVERNWCCLCGHRFIPVLKKNFLASSIYDSTYAWRDNILTLKTCTGTYRNKW
jgi:hypothetical protein